MGGFPTTAGRPPARPQWAGHSPKEFLGAPTIHPCFAAVALPSARLPGGVKRWRCPWSCYRCRGSVERVTASHPGMSFDTYTHFTSLLALFAGGAAVVVSGVFALTAAGVGRFVAARDWLREALGEVGIWLAAAVATASTVGSLIYSEHFDLIPCRFCWYQRIFMYPLAVILIIAAFRRDTAGARRYGLPLAGIGILISGYHYLIQQFPNLESGACSVDVPCSAPYVWRYGFLSIPWMALAGFALIITLLLTTRAEPT